tara:strand:- start:215 stop:544 length:330 start_codon:yes stop_codon:yes gene_type:complete
MTIKIKILNYTIKISKKRDTYNKKVKREIKYKIPPSLIAPTAPQGYVHRWIRAETMAFSKNKKSGNVFSLVKPTKKQKNLYPTVDGGRFNGYIGVGGLLLAKVKRLEIR